MRELYQMRCKKYHIVLLLLLIIPILIGTGYFFDLSYMEEGNSIIEENMLEYCANMQQLIKSLYFLAIIYIACDVFSGGLEEGQIQTVLTQPCTRRKLFLQKYFAICIFVALFHFMFWLVNMGIYISIMIKRKTWIPVPESIVSYVEIFFGYLEAFCVLTALAMCIGLYLRKIHSIILVYLLWFVLRYVDKIVSLKNIFTEFTADALIKPATMGNAECNWSVYMINAILCILIIILGIYIFQKKDLT